MANTVDIIISTWNNRRFLAPCLDSLLPSLRAGDHVFVVNNGEPKSCDWITDPAITVLQSGGENLGWAGGLRRGLSVSRSPYVVFCNDDVYFPAASRYWLTELLWTMERDERIGAVGPSSNVVMGYQSIFAHPSLVRYTARFLIGFCLLVRRSALDAVGGVDATLPGGDDLDLSIRLRAQGYLLVGDRRVFVFHHGSTTGARVHGAPGAAFGWDSAEHTEQIDRALIAKHGEERWREVRHWTDAPPDAYVARSLPFPMREGVV